MISTQANINASPAAMGFPWAEGLDLADLLFQAPPGTDGEAGLELGGETEGGAGGAAASYAEIESALLAGLDGKAGFLGEASQSSSPELGAAEVKANPDEMPPTAWGSIPCCWLQAPLAVATPAPPLALAGLPVNDQPGSNSETPLGQSDALVASQVPLLATLKVPSAASDERWSERTRAFSVELELTGTPPVDGQQSLAAGVNGKQMAEPGGVAGSLMPPSSELTPTARTADAPTLRAELVNAQGARMPESGSPEGKPEADSAAKSADEAIEVRALPVADDETDLGHQDGTKEQSAADHEAGSPHEKQETTSESSPLSTGFSGTGAVNSLEALAAGGPTVVHGEGKASTLGGTTMVDAHHSIGELRRQAAQQIPVASLVVDVASASGDPVRLRLQQGAGPVRIDVHSPQPALREVLSSHLGDLLGQLQAAGYEGVRAMPAVPLTAAPAHANFYGQAASGWGTTTAPAVAGASSVATSAGDLGGKDQDEAPSQGNSGGSGDRPRRAGSRGSRPGFAPAGATGGR